MWFIGKALENLVVVVAFEREVSNLNVGVNILMWTKFLLFVH